MRQLLNQLLLGKIPNVCNEYKAASQNITANVRYVESRQNHGSKKWLLLALTGQLRNLPNQ
jgi:hypothetical protein